MDELAPFLTEIEQKEIRQIGNLFFKGVNPAEEKECIDAWNKWHFFFDIFLMIVDRKYGNLLHLPFAGTPSIQPYKSYQVIELIQTLYFEKLKREYENIKES